MRFFRERRKSLREGFANEREVSSRLCAPATYRTGGSLPFVYVKTREETSRTRIAPPVCVRQDSAPSRELTAIPNSEMLWECGLGLPSPRPRLRLWLPSPKLGRGAGGEG
jgi:hypothetical protein